MTAAPVGPAVPVVWRRRPLGPDRAYVDDTAAVWCNDNRLPAGGGWWPFSASGLALFDRWTRDGARALCVA